MPNPLKKIFNKDEEKSDSAPPQEEGIVETTTTTTTETTTEKKQQNGPAEEEQADKSSTFPQQDAEYSGKVLDKAQAADTATDTSEAKSPYGTTGAIDSQKRAGIDVLTRMTQRSNQALMAGVNKVKELQVQYIESEHVLWGLLSDASIYQLISDLKVTPTDIQKDLDTLFTKGEFTGNPQFSPRVKRIFELSMSAARALGYEFISPEHILLGLAQEGEGEAAKILAKNGLTVEVLNQKVTGKEEKKGEAAEGTKSGSSLDQFTHDLTQMAKEGKLDPVVARSAEIERVMHIISRRTKNNPVLIGEAGVGKTAIVEGLAQRIAAGNVPEALRSKRVLSVDLMSIIAGASHRGEFEQRLKNLIREVKAAGGEIILFIDEIHNMVGTGGGGGSAMDASNILKPSLARGELQTIGATTVTEYRKHMEKDRALERRFQPVMVDEPSPEQALEMVTALQDKYAEFHKVTIPDEALKAAVYLSNRYIGDRFLPDKAVDLIDEAASSIRLPAISLPEDIHSLQERRKRLEEEKQEALQNSDDVRVAAVERKLEKNAKELAEKQKAYETKKATTTNTVTPEIIQEIISRWTNIPLSKLTETESEKLLNLEELLHKRIIDQEHAIDAVAEAVRRGRAGLKSSKRPIGSFVFMGPTGVGKTELAKALAEILFGSDEKMVRLDMTEYMEKHEVAKLIGAPPGYVGYEEGGQLTEAVRRKPYSVVLLDEVEKAHADVFNILLQILDDGRLTDNKGRTIDFKNTILIATSNIGTQLIQREMLTGSKYDFLKQALSTLVFSPTGRAILTLEKRIWQKEKEGKSWTTSKLEDYFQGQKVEGADLLTASQKFPVGGFDVHVIAPSGEEMITAGGRVWQRKSTTAKSWKTLSLIDYFKDHTVENAEADKPEQQLPTAKVGTIAISLSETQIVTYGGRYWMRNSLAANKWQTGTLKDYVEGSVIRKSGDQDIRDRSQDNRKSGKQTAAPRSPDTQKPLPGKPDTRVTSAVSPQVAADKPQGKQSTGPAEPDPELEKKVKDLMGESGRKSGDQDTGDRSQDSRKSGSKATQSLDTQKPLPGKPDTRMNSQHPLPTDHWDVHLFTPEGAEIIIYGKRFWRREKFGDKNWTTGELSGLFRTTHVADIDPANLPLQLPIGQQVDKARKAKEAEEEAKYLKLKTRLLDELRKFFRPELLNRFDDTLVFKPLSPEDLLKIVDLQFKDVNKLLEEQNIGFEVTDAAKQEIATEGYDPVFGARPLRRTIQRMIENPISSMIIKGELKAGDIVHVDFDGNDFIFTAKVHPSRAKKPTQTPPTPKKPSAPPKPPQPPSPPTPKPPTPPKPSTSQAHSEPTKPAATPWS